MLRTGLRRDTRSVEVTVDEPDPAADRHGWGALAVTTVEGATMSGWWRRDGVFLLTIAADVPIRPPEQLPGCGPV